MCIYIYTDVYMWCVYCLVYVLYKSLHVNIIMTMYINNTKPIKFLAKTSLNMSLKCPKDRYL